MDVLGFLLQQVEIWVLKGGIHTPRAEGDKRKMEGQIPILFLFVEILLQNNYAFKAACSMEKRGHALNSQCAFSQRFFHKITKTGNLAHY